jgi:membrane protease YdiL (CAAX protease family)
VFSTLPDTAKAVTFYVIAFILVFAIAASPGILGEASPALSMLTSITSVLIMMLVVTRDGWSKEGWRSLGLFTAGLRGWWVAFLFPAAVLIICDAVLLATGLASFAVPEAGRSALQISANIGAGLFISIGFAFCEEIGWRGYMLPKLLGLGAVAAVFIVGFLHGMWHLPLMLMTSYYHADGNPMIVVPLFLVTLTLAGAFFGYLRLWTGSVWPVAIAHGVFNLVWNIGAELIKAERPETMEYIGGESGVLIIVALVITAMVLVPRIKALQS